MEKRPLLRVEENSCNEGVSAVWVLLGHNSAIVISQQQRKRQRSNPRKGKGRPNNAAKPHSPLWVLSVQACRMPSSFLTLPHLVLWLYYICISCLLSSVSTDFRHVTESPQGPKSLELCSDQLGLCRLYYPAPMKKKFTGINTDLLSALWPMKFC